MAEQNILVPPTGYNTYIGARYVPVFDGEWSATKQYEPLVVVLYQGNSYTSRTWVPAGIPVSNGTYWAQTGNYDAQLAGIQETINGYIDKYNARLSVKNRKFIFIHDSYGFGYTPGASTSNGWIYWVSQYLGLRQNVDFWALPYAYIPGGYGMAPTVANTHAGWADLLKGLDGTITDKDAITDIFIFGGTNDTSLTGSIDEGMAQLDAVIKARYVNARVNLGFIGMSSDVSRWNSALYNVRNTYMTNCGKYGWNWIDNVSYAWHDYSWMSSDGIHPTQEGYQKASVWMAEAIAFGDCYVERNFSINISTAKQHSEQLNIYSNNVVNIKQVNGTVFFNYRGNSSDGFFSMLTIQLLTGALRRGTYILFNLPSWIRGFPSGGTQYYTLFDGFIGSVAVSGQPDGTGWYKGQGACVLLNNTFNIVYFVESVATPITSQFLLQRFGGEESLSIWYC